MRIKWNNWYELKGISKSLYKAWKGMIRSDIIVIHDNDDIKFIINLNRYEAHRMRKHIEEYNRLNSNLLALVRI